MAVPLFVQAGSGSTITTGTGTVSLTSATAGNLVILQLEVDGLAADWSQSGATNVSALDGTTDARDTIVVNFTVGTDPPANALHSLYCGRVTANGTCSFDITVGASGEDIFARIYEFSGASLGTTLDTVIENGADPDLYTGDSGSGTTVFDIGCTTNDIDRLALEFVAIDSNQAIGSFTGETGGDWTEAVAEYVGGGTVGTLQLQTAEMAAADTISGGTVSIGSANWGVLALAIIPGPAATGATIAWITA